MIKSPIPIHPGIVLAEVYMKDMGLTMSALAALCKLSRGTISTVINKKAAVSPKTAVKLEQALGMRAEVWVRMQAEYDLNVAREKPR